MTVAAVAAMAAGLAFSVQAQTFTPAERQLLMQPSAIGGAPSAFTPPGKTEASKTTKNAKRAPVSISSELNRETGGAAGTPELRKPREIAGRKPLDQRVPFGPLSLGLQADTAPRSSSLVTPVPDGMSQFKKDRAEPYVGVSIIDIKR